MKTIMKEIPNCPGYFALTDGRIYSTRTNKGHGPGRFLKQCQLNRGHLIVRLFSKYNRKLVHRLILETFIGPCPEGMECRHLDGNPTNNHLSNLCWGTRSENQKDKVRHGRWINPTQKGDKHPRSKLTNEQARTIYKLYHEFQQTQRGLAKQFNVGKTTIAHLVNGDTWQ